MISWIIAAAVVFILLAIYPGELSWVRSGGHRWLYDRAAQHYNDKWLRHDYKDFDQQIARAAALAADLHSPPAVLDLACGTGRATLSAYRTLGEQADYTAVDFSTGMLAQFSTDNGALPQWLRDNVKTECNELGDWLAHNERRYELVLLMEASEFIPGNRALTSQLGRTVRAGGQLVMTRPAGFWWLLFPGRGQSRKVIAQRLREAGFSEPDFIPWRQRYELVTAHRQAD